MTIDEKTLNNINQALARAWILAHEGYHLDVLEDKSVEEKIAELTETHLRVLREIETAKNLLNNTDYHWDESLKYKNRKEQ